MGLAARVSRYRDRRESHVVTSEHLSASSENSSLTEHETEFTSSVVSL